MDSVYADRETGVALEGSIAPFGSCGSIVGHVGWLYGGVYSILAAID